MSRSGKCPHRLFQAKCGRPKWRRKQQPEPDQRQPDWARARLVDAKAKCNKQPHRDPDNRYSQSEDTVLSAMGRIWDLNADDIADGEEEELQGLDGWRSAYEMPPLP